MFAVLLLPRSAEGLIGPGHSKKVSDDRRLVVLYDFGKGIGPACAYLGYDLRVVQQHELL